MNKKILEVLSFLFAFSLFSCATTAGKTEISDFYTDNLSQFREFSLSNGIPVVLKNIPSAKGIELRLVFAGGASVSPKNKAGMDLLTFELLSRSPALEEQVSHGRCFTISLCSNDYSSFGFSSQPADFDENLEIFAKSVLEPRYTHEDYLELETKAANGALDRSENIRFALLDTVNAGLYKGHPYYEGIYYKISSRVSEYDIEQNLRSLLNAKRITIIAAGNFSPSAGKKDKRLPEEIFEERSVQLQKNLESLFSSVPAAAFSEPAIPSVKFSGKDVIKTFEFAGNSYCAALCFSCPTRGSRDYEAFALTTLVLDYVLRRDIVQTQAASLCGTAVLNGRQSAVLVLALGTDEKRDIKHALSEALNAFPSEEAVLPLLDSFKNIYVSKLYSTSQNEYATLDQISSSIFYEGSASAYLRRIEKIQSVTVQDISECFKKYFVQEQSTFFMVKRD